MSVVPLESNPQVFNELAHELGLSPEFEFMDVYSLTDPDLLSFIPRPISALILLFPITDSYEKFREETSAKTAYSVPEDEKIYWFPQRIKNACGLYALLHSTVNGDKLVEGSKLSKFKDSVKSHKSHEKRTELVNELQSEYSRAAQMGQTEAPDAEDDITLHFITFAYSDTDNKVYELDGRRNGPIALGESSGDVLSDLCVVERVKKYMEMGEGQLNFSLMGLGPGM